MKFTFNDSKQTEVKSEGASQPEKVMVFSKKLNKMIEVDISPRSSTTMVMLVVDEEAIPTSNNKMGNSGS